MDYEYLNQRRKVLAAIKHAQLNSLSHEQSKQPLLEDFGLTTSSGEKIDTYNNTVRKKRAKYGWSSLAIYFIFAIVVLLLLNEQIGAVLLGGYPIPLVLYYTVYKPVSLRFFPDHPQTKKLEEYKILLQKYNDLIATQKREFWTNLTGRQFEIEFGKLLRPFFYKVEVTRGSGDGGVDIVITDDESKIVIQCKNHKKQIGPEPVRAIVGVMHQFNADRAAVISLGGFSCGAIEFAKLSHNLFLYDLNDVVRLSESVILNKVSFAGKTYVRPSLEESRPVTI